MRIIFSAFILSVFVLACAPKSAPGLREPRNPKGDIGPDPVSDPETPSKIFENWSLKDPTLDGAEGTSANRAYKKIKLDFSKTPILVAVIDSGVDVLHKDLKDVIWSNPGELGNDSLGRDRRTNGVDDDSNGYVDDVHGWNFLGSVDKAGKPIHILSTTLEVTREKVRLQKKKTDLEKIGQTLSLEEQRLLDEVMAIVRNAVGEAHEDLERFQALKAQVEPLYRTIAPLIPNKKFAEVTPDDLKKLVPSDEVTQAAREALLLIMEQNKLSRLGRIDRFIENAKASLGHYFNESIDPRKDILPEDEASDFTQRFYGNNDVTGPDADHGTHVAGLIAASRSNNLGIDGLAQNVKIMSIRAVPDGDEYDKDVASAVRYAVANGARIINMSFGKRFSPYKAEVDRAFLEAAQQGVLIVHSAGNDSKNNDEVPSYPSRYLAGAQKGAIPGWIEVGASSRELGKELPAIFSNYGALTVDIFSPGVRLISTIPGDEYAEYSGTSMAGPVVAGVAALLMTQDSSLTAEQVKDLILSSGRRYPGLEVRQPMEGGIEKLMPFSGLSVSGAIVDALAALKKLLL